MKLRCRNIFLVLLVIIGNRVHAALPDWPQLYDTSTVPALNVQLRETDWNTILADETFDVEVPALFWANQDGPESAILVSIRRKSATPINGKVSFKIDINEYEDDDPRAQGLWHGVKKLSLENGDDVDIVSEGIAWAMHRIAVEQGIYPAGHLPGKANWATLTPYLTQGCIAEPCGPFDLGEVFLVLDPLVYLNVEQPDKSFLKNRDLWISEETWLYKQDEPALPAEIKEAGCPEEVPNSPVVNALQCAPFIAGREGGSRGKKDRNSEPSVETCDMAVVNELVDMDILLVQAAIGAFSANRDDTFGNEHNYYFLDYSAPGNCQILPDPYALEARKRLHFPWDLDASLTKVDRNVYGDLQGNRRKIKLSQTGYQRLLLEDYNNGELAFRTMYNTALLEMAGEDFMAGLFDTLDDIQLVIGDALEADPNSKISSAGSHIQNVKNFLSERANIVREQVCLDNPGLNGCAP
ncbi:MAG: CotH kinase family protein [Halioglobus sp.]